MKKKLKKILSIVLSLAMVITSVTIYNTSTKADVADIEITASVSSSGLIEAKWTNPSGTVRTKCYVNEEDDQHYAKAANGWVWTLNNASEVRTSLDTVTGTNGGLDVTEGGDFTIIVVAYGDEDCTQEIGRGVSNEVHINKNVNTVLSVKLDRYESDGKTTVISWQTIGGAAKYVVYNGNTQIKAENSGASTWTYFDSPTATQSGTYEATVKAYNSAGEEIAITENTITLNYYVESTDETEYVAPANHDISKVDTTAWTKLSTKSGEIDSTYYINSTHTLATATWFGLYAPHSDAAYHNERDKCVLGDKAAFIIQQSGIKTIWVNGVKYDNYSKYFNNQGNCLEIALDLFNVGENVVSLVKSSDGTDITFAVKVEAPVEFVQPKFDPSAVAEWTALSGTSDNGAKAYISSAITSTFGNGGLRGLYSAGKSVNWNISDAMKEVAVLGFVTLGGNASKIIISDTTDLSNPVQIYSGTARDTTATDVYSGNHDTVYINQSLVNANPGETKYYTISARDTTIGDGEGNFLLKVVGAEVEETTVPTVQYSVTVDGTEVSKVESGKTYTLPTTAQYGYYSDGKMYKAGATVEVTGDIAFTSVNELSVSVAQGAGIKLVDNEAGIRFQATVSTDNENAVNSDAITTGMLITTKDLYENLGNSTLTLASTYTFKNIVNSGWYNSTFGTYCGSVVGINEANYIRNFIGKAYVTINYADGTNETIYSGMTGARSIQYVAQAVKNAGYPGVTAYKDIIDAYAAAK